MAKTPFSGLHVIRVVLADLGRNADIGAEESGPKFRNEFLAGITCIAEALAAEVAVEAGLMAGPVRLMPTSA